MLTSGITLDELRKWGGDEAFSQGLAIANSGDVFDVTYDDETLIVAGKIRKPGWDMKVSFKLEPGGRIRSFCPCERNQRYGMVCDHVLAIGIALVAMETEAAELERQQAETAAAALADDEPPVPEGNYIEVEMAPRFYALLSGSRASLSIAVDAYYGEIDFPACSVQAERTVYLEDPDDDLVRRTRSVKSERAAMDALAKWGFAPGYKDGDLKLYITDPQRVLNFLGAGLPAFRRQGWRIDLSDRLSALTDVMPSVVPTVKARQVGKDFEVRVSFDAMGEEIPAVEIQAAVNRGDGYIMRDGAVVLLDNTAIEQISQVLADCAVAKSSVPPEDGWVRYRGVYAAFVRDSFDFLDCLDLEDRSTAGWRDSLPWTDDGSGRADARFEPVALGPLDNVLRPYQKQGVYWMRFLEESGTCGLLADEMGLGKTLQTLTWLSLSTAAAPRLPALIVCPTSLVRNWEAEAKKFTPWLKTLVVSGPDRAQDFGRIGESDVVVTSYALLQRDFEAAYYEQDFSAVVIDEAQHIKNAETKNAKAVKLLRARRRLALTGTPVENSVMDVWSIFDFLMPGYLGDQLAFKAHYEEPVRNGEAELVLPRLKRQIAPFMLRRVKKSVAKDLPDKIVKVSYCPLGDEARRDYSAALAKTRTAAGGLVRQKGFAKSKFEILAMLMKLRQLASHGKLDAFMEQLGSAVEGGHKVLVFSQFVTTLKLLSEALKQAGVRHSYLDGSTKDRLGECNRFNRSREIPVFLISLMAGGTGLNLTGADMVMHYDPWWNPAVEDQATDRAHRIGQKKTVYVMKMIAEGTIEEKVLELQRRKQAVISATVSTTDAAVMEALSAEDLRELLST